MGYSGRYHAASLAAVFLALAIGILIGVGLGHNVLSGAQKDLEQSLKSDLAQHAGPKPRAPGPAQPAATSSAADLPGAGRADLLSGKRIAVVALGGAARRHQGRYRGRRRAATARPRRARGGRRRARAAGHARRSRPTRRDSEGSGGPRPGRPDRSRTALWRVARRRRADLQRFRGSAAERDQRAPGRIYGVILVREQPD